LGIIIATSGGSPFLGNQTHGELLATKRINSIHINFPFHRRQSGIMSFVSMGENGKNKRSIKKRATRAAIELCNYAPCAVAAAINARFFYFLIA